MKDDALFVNFVVQADGTVLASGAKVSEAFRQDLKDYDYWTWRQFIVKMHESTRKSTARSSLPVLLSVSKAQTDSQRN